MTKINCPWCRANVDNKLDKLAEHIFKVHSDDVGLCTWARVELAKLNGPDKQGVIKKIAKAIRMYRGKPVDRIPPKRQEKLPEYLKRQLPK